MLSRSSSPDSNVVPSRDVFLGATPPMITFAEKSFQFGVLMVRILV
jgi:hypothetical protein